MPQMFPMSWVFIYLYTLLGLIMILVLVSYVFSFSVESSLVGEDFEVDSWLW
uniref:ATP synthetase F0 Subunit 8 n=1 Tax=Appalachioria falcifera TaxID=382869 RepID=S4T0S5_APPFA|nr:ATP synthase F0 subunit 8 [Appalachioria falcifera]AFR77030.1 ATP synthetase F0 Subunit 8 [Appalachioria falcifera]